MTVALPVVEILFRSGTATPARLPPKTTTNWLPDDRAVTVAVPVPPPGADALPSIVALLSAVCRAVAKTAGVTVTDRAGVVTVIG